MKIKNNQSTMYLMHQTCAVGLVCLSVMSPSLSAAAPVIPGFYGKVNLPAPAANSLPQLRTAPSGATVTEDGSRNQLTVTQEKDKVTIDWNSFNIGSASTVRFEQKKDGVVQRDWAALNRIYDANPSQIYGKLQADGKVYLINQNGILFGPGSQVNVGALTASALNLWQSDFTAGLLRFRSENYQHPDYDPADPARNLTLPPPNAEAAVANHGNITTGNGGSVILLGPKVENAGTITASMGKINLVAVEGAGSGATSDNSEVSIGDSSERGVADVSFSDKAAPGTAVNFEGGQLIADSGRIGLYGATVRQEGLVRAVTAIKRGGEIFLAARDRVTTGARSLTESPVSDSDEKIDQSFSFSSGAIRIGGLSTRTGEEITPVKQPLQRIEHYGAIAAPGGSVDMFAKERVFLDSGSSISVAGLWLDLPADANLLEVQLNSVELANDYGQKSGPLKGEKVYIDVLTGSAIGDVKGYYLAREKSARERSTRGGTITIGEGTILNNMLANPLGELIVKEGAVIDFSGGGGRYTGGSIGTSRLLSGNKVYDIGSAPQWLSYDKILGQQTVSYRKFGVSEEYTGIYFGGGSAVKDYTPGRVVGSDAGTLSVASRQVVLDGTLLAAVTRGLYQTKATSHTDNDHQAYDISVARGLEQPLGGTLQIGLEGGNGDLSAVPKDSLVEEIVVLPTTTPLAGSFAAESPLTRTRSELSATLLSSIGLSRLSLFANTTIATEAGARLTLLPRGIFSNGSVGSSFTARARRIEHRGAVGVAGGSAEFMIVDNITSNPADNDRYIDMASTLYFAPGSVVSVKGETIDNSSARTAGDDIRIGRTSGGRVAIQDLTYDGLLTGNNLVVARGALLDVSGGYEIDQKGKIIGGDAGTLEFRAMNLSLAGELRGLALPGKRGGEITLHAGEIVVGATGANLPENLPPDVPPPDFLNGRLFLADDRFRETGFTRIGLTAINDVTFAAGSVLELSHVRLPVPVAAGGAANGTGNVLVAVGGTVNSPDYLGETSVSATAGAYFKDFENPTYRNTTIPKNQNARVNVAAGASVRTAPGGSITMKGPSVEVAGELGAPGGSIALTAKSGNLTLNGGSRVSAAGYLKPVTTTVAGLPAGDLPQAAGTVSLEATSGSIILENRARVDVSGTGPTERLIPRTDGLPVRVTEAGDPGSLNLTYGRGLELDGEIAGQALLDGVRGGTLAITKNNSISSSLLVTESDMRRYQASGFDALTFKSPDAIGFTGAIDLTVARSLTLDAPKLTGTGRDDVTLRAPWLRLVNTSQVEPNGISASDDRGALALAGDWIDVEGCTAVTGFGNVRLAAQRDLRLTDAQTKSGGNSVWRGKLETAGDLTLQAARIYPTTLASFTVKTHGTATILQSGTIDNSPIYSAGGNLTIQAEKGINHQGVLVAPMGSITLDAGGSGRVYLADESLVSISGAVPVAYGTFDGTYWTVKDVDDFNNIITRPKVEGAPVSSIELKGGDVIVKERATLNMAGGGSIYTSLFQPGIEGSTDPITISKAGRADRYVILPDNGVQLPGFSYTDANGTSRAAGAVHLAATRLDDGTWLKEGTYSLLPERYAFVPGARIISDLGTTVAPGAQPRTTEGYQVVTGYGTFFGTDVQSRQLKGYSIRLAADVLKEGNYTVKELAAGDAGSLVVKGNTAVMTGSVHAAPLPGYKPGSLSLIGAAVTVQETVAGLPAGFDFDSPVPADLTGQLQVAAATLTGYGLDTLKLGDTQTTKTLTVQQGSTLTARNITLAVAADGQLTVESGATVNGLSKTGGSVTLSAPSGQVNLQANSLLHASNAITLDVDNIYLEGGVVADRGSLTLKSGNIYFVPDGYTRPAGEKGLYLTEKLWQGFSRNDELRLTSSADLTFRRDVDLTVNGLLTVDARQLTGPANVTFNAGKITLLNSGTSAVDPAVASTGRLTFNADEISVASSTKESIVFNGFATVSLASRGDLTLKGAGALKTGGDLNVSAARMTTSYYRDDATSYTAANFLVSANGAIDITNSGGTAGTATTPGGTLAIQGKSISQSGTIEVASGQVQLTARDGITLMDGARLLARGAKVETTKSGEYEYLPGGRIILTGNDGPVNLQSGSLVDVSAADRGDAGAISLISSTAGVTVAGGTIVGIATVGKGKGGALTLDTTTLDLPKLNDELIAGGFTERLDIRARQGNLDVPDMTAHEIVLAADDSSVGNGRIDVAGTVAALADTKGNGGWVELSAQQDLKVTGSILAKGTTSGGEILLGSTSGTLSLQNSALLDVSGGSGGSVYLRARRNDSNDNVSMALAGGISGASQVVAEAFKVYTKSNSTITATDITNPLTSLNPGWLTEADSFMQQAATITSSLLPTDWNADTFHLRPGIEVRRDGDLTFASNFKLPNLTAGTWDLSSNHYVSNKEPGILTLRATGNLTINASLVDHPTPLNFTDPALPKLTSANMQASWGLNLVAGADLQGASPLALTATAAGKDLNIGTGKAVYSENAPIRFASANDTKIGKGLAAGYMANTTMAYNLASYGGTIKGTTGNDLVFTDAGAIQTALGDIDLRIGRDLNLGQNDKFGAIRTTGEYDFKNMKVETGPGSDIIRPAQIADYWTYRNGGSITLDVGGAVKGDINKETSNDGKANAWDYVYGGGTTTNKKNMRLSASFEGVNSTEGIATMGGGDIYVRTGGSFTSQVGAFGTDNLAYTGSGNLAIVAGGDLHGRFRVMDGSASLTTAGNFGTTDEMPVIEIAATQLTVATRGDVHLGAVLNPDNIRANLFKSSTTNNWNLTYTPDASMRIVSLAGDITFNGESTFGGYTVTDPRQRILPASLTMLASGDILLQNDFSQAPAQSGTLRLVAGGSIDGGYRTNGAILFMTDQAPKIIYGYQTGTAPDIYSDFGKSLSLVHQGDKDPVEISAGVDIMNLQLNLAKKAEIGARQDIKGFYYTGQNIDPADVTSIRAGRDIHYDFILPEINILPNYGIQQSGPGALVIQAGRNIELGNSKGLTTNGNFFNTLLGSKGADLIVVAGAKRDLQPEDAVLFFNGKDGKSDHEDNSLNGLRKAGIEYTGLQAQGKIVEAQQRIEEARRTIISRWFDEPTNDGSGNISMTSSQISTKSGRDEIFIMAKGVVDVGKTSIQSGESKKEGIVTVKGGPINIYAGGDINVNESRVMTFMGGDITIWSDLGNINAGRGSKTAVSPPEPGEVPAAGSGLRALTYDPDGAEGLLEEPAPGDISLFAPKGVIDAGEAGIAGGKVTLGATEVLNATNISFSAGSVGVPTSGGSSVSVGALSGAGNVTDSSRMIEQTTTSSAKDKTVRTGTQVVDDFMSKFLDIKVLNFDLDANDGKDDKDKEKK